MNKRKKVFGRSFLLALLLGTVLFSIILGSFGIIESKKMFRQQKIAAKQMEQMEETLMQLQLQFHMNAEK